MNFLVFILNLLFVLWTEWEMRRKKLNNNPNPSSLYLFAPLDIQSYSYHLKSSMMEDKWLICSQFIVVIEECGSGVTSIK